MKHTEGKWKYEPVPQGTRHNLPGRIVNDQGIPVAETFYGFSFPKSECIANAKDIVHAHNVHNELVGALKDIMSNLGWVAPTKGYCLMPTELFEQIKKVLAKAESGCTETDMECLDRLNIPLI